MPQEHLGQFTYMSKFIKEVLRYFSPVPMIGRVNNDQPIVLDGIEIPANVSVWIHIYALHHNESIWKNNMVFDPERFDAGQRDDNDVYGFIPFSAGSRNCIGQSFAMNEIKINIAKVVKRFEVTVVPSKEAVIIPDVVMRAENGLYVGFKPRK
ncbi:Cytochrome P450 4X1 [Mactra antiquata]